MGHWATGVAKWASEQLGINEGDRRLKYSLSFFLKDRPKAAYSDVTRGPLRSIECRLVLASISREAKPAEAEDNHCPSGRFGDGGHKHTSS